MHLDHWQLWLLMGWDKSGGHYCRGNDANGCKPDALAESKLTKYSVPEVSEFRAWTVLVINESDSRQFNPK
jgi:hypothetical protein